MKYVEVTIKVESDLLAKADRLAKENEWTLDQLIEYLIYAYESPQDGPVDDA